MTVHQKLGVILVNKVVLKLKSAKNPSNQSSVLPPKVQQQRPRSPERNPQPPKEQQQGSSLSSYLQQIHDSQYEQAQQSHFSQGKTRFSE